ncbi:Glycine-tRNA synthetase heterodimeric protein [Dioscorea alata]|uniref:Glycine-tRNA synthetase heterodimeric protein n=2 Tax=Dioscorea alata TaxID=55571 RepID=A0ACB7UCD8_DIOAL|nr:Glycine-tRNA synthetase heterodimeric protein [Dioscorea alata]KAH7657988.1 Glycine-tRNA synthetase heterodimeric protein [Dioscorea alata]
MSPTSFYIFGLFMLCRGWITSRKLGMLMELLIASYFWRVLGAWGLGWEVWMDGMEITQFTYFQHV